jgi:hypothetical protein
MDKPLFSSKPIKQIMNLSNKLFFLFLILIGISCGDNDDDQTPDVDKPGPVSVQKSNSMPLYVHYMPWFDTPRSSGDWGIHWKMANRNPDRILDNGQREIAAHFYPLIGPYSSSDEDVIRYHFLLMKYAGIDGILIDWYGIAGTNGDLQSLYANSSAIIEETEDAGMQFGIVLEDRFAASEVDVRRNLEFMSSRYYPKDEYIHFDNRPLSLIFGPITVHDYGIWEQLLSATPEEELFLPLWYNGLAYSTLASGEYAWVFQDEVAGLENFYTARTSTAFIGGAAYPGFKDFYEEGGWGNQIDWEIEVSANTFRKTLDLATAYESNLDFLQLVTWNDFGEGTMIEPTVEFEFKFLEQVQDFTGVPYGLEELQLIHEWYLKKTDPVVISSSENQRNLEQAYYYLVALRLEDAKALLDQL